MEDKELYCLIEKMLLGDVAAKYEIIVKFENLMKKESYINCEFNQDCYDYIFDELFKSMKNFKNFK